MDLSRKEIFADLIDSTHGDNPLMFSESEQAENKARFMIAFRGITEGSYLDRYNNNDTIVSESGVFFSFTQSESTFRDTKLFEKFRIINYKEKRLEIPFIQSNDPND